MGGTRHEVQHDLAVHAGLEDGTLFFQVMAQLNGIDQIAVVGNRQGCALVGYQQWLGVGDMGGTGGGVADMTNGHMTRQTLEDGFGKNFRNQSHVFMNRDFLAIWR